MSDELYQDDQDLKLDGDKTPNNDDFDSKTIWDKVAELGIEDEEFINSLKTLDFQRKHNRGLAVDPKTGKKYRDLLKELTTSAPPAPVVTPPVADPQVDVEKAARKVAMDMKLEEYLGSVPEDKRATVKEFYGSITTGKEIGISNFNDYMSAACRAAGVEVQSRSAHRINNFASGAVPPTSKPGPTPEQIEMAKRAGLDPNEVYGDKADFSNLLNAHKFIGDKKDEFN